MDLIFLWFAIGMSNYLVYEARRFTIKNLNKEVDLEEVEDYYGAPMVLPAAVIITSLYFLIIVPLWPLSVYRRFKK